MAVPHYADVPNNTVITFNNSDTTTAKSLGVTVGTYGTRVKEIPVMTGPTTAPGTGKFCILLNDKVIRLVALVNTVDTEIITFRFDNLILKSGDVLKGVMRTTITSGGSIDVSVLAEDLSS